MRKPQRVHHRTKFEPFFRCGRKANGDLPWSHDVRNVTCSNCMEGVERDTKIAERIRTAA